MLLSTTVVIRGFYDIINLTSGIYICKEPFKAFLDGQMSEDKPTPLLATANLLFRLPSFLHLVIFF